MSVNKILIIDDDSEVRSLISDVLSDEGYKTSEAGTEKEIFESLKNNTYDLVFLDLWIGEDESAGIKFLTKIKKLYPDVPVVIVSGHGTIDVAVKAIQKGAFDFIEKPFIIDRLLITTQRAIELCRLQRENSKLKSNKIDTSILNVGKSTFAQSIISRIEKFASTNSRIFIKACSGINTDSIAYYIHKHSLRKDYPFIYCNCHSNNDEKLENDLFGTTKSYGYIEQANFGTLFLDNINKLPKICQNRLLQFLKENQINAGERKSGYLDVRIITNSQLSDEDIPADFSRELYYRLNISRINIPPLKERREDIIPLVNYYLNNSEIFFGLKNKKISESCLAILQSYDWPGNIHQLKSVVENSLINASDHDCIYEDSLPTELTTCAQERLESMNVAKLMSYPLKEAKERFESEYLKAQMIRFSGNISKTASFIGMERSALHRKLKNLGVINDCRPKK